MSEEIYTLREAAAYLKVCYRTVFRMVKANTLHASRVGRQWRIRQQDLDRFLAGNMSSQPPVELQPPDSSGRPGVAMISGLASNEIRTIYFRIQVLNRYKQDARYVFEEDEVSGRIAFRDEFKEEHSAVSGNLGKFWDRIKEIKFQKVTLTGGVIAVSLNSDYYHRVVHFIAYEYAHWHNYRIHTPVT